MKKKLFIVAILILITNIIFSNLAFASKIVAILPVNGTTTVSKNDASLPVKYMVTGNYFKKYALGDMYQYYKSDRRIITQYWTSVNSRCEILPDNNIFTNKVFSTYYCVIDKVYKAETSIFNAGTNKSYIKMDYDYQVSTYYCKYTQAITRVPILMNCNRIKGSVIFDSSTIQ